MQKIFYSIALCLLSVSVSAQVITREFGKYPVFPECENVDIEGLPSCFNQTLIQFVLDNFETPAIVEEEQYVGQMVVLFEITKKGTFKLLNTDAVYEELKDQAQAVFEKLPQIKPATYDAEPAYLQFSMPIQIPLSRNRIENQETSDVTEAIIAEEKPSGSRDTLVNELENIASKVFDRKSKYSSALNIPFSYQVYSRFDPDLNQVGVNAHTASRPFLYNEVNKYHNLESKENELQLDKSTWFGRKFFNEHMVRFQGENYWFTIDPAADLQLGIESDDRREENFSYNNTRAVFIQGGLGSKFSFYTAVYESQGRFAQYFNDFARSIRPDGGNPAIIPGRGIAEESNAGDFDYPVAEGYISYSPSKFFNLQLGTGNQFIGDGYRSLFLSDITSNYPYLKFSTNFWKIKYDYNILSLRDVRPEVTADGSFLTKYAANHYLSINVNKRLNLGFFESVIFENDNGGGFDPNFLNPIIFLRNVEFQRGSRGGNALLGLSAKYKFSHSINAYAQLIIDELRFSDLFSNNGSFRNKHGYQLGIKYYNAFKVDNLTLQAEYNQVRPFTFANNNPVLSYTNANQPLAHPFGANFREFVGIARYQNKRWYGSLRLIYAQRGFDGDNIDEVFIGQNLFGSEDNRPADNGNELLQGNRVNSLFADIEIGYLLNPATNLKLFVNPIYRDFSAETQTETVFDNNTLWLNIGFRTDLFNWHFDVN